MQRPRLSTAFLIGSLLLLPALARAAQEGTGDEPPPPPTAEAVAKAVQAIEDGRAAAAKKDGTDDLLLAALRAAADVPDKAVVGAVADSLRADHDEVRTTALDTLGRIAEPSALDALARAYKKDRSLRESEPLATALLRAIGRQGDPRAVALLADAPTSTPGTEPLRARILGLARVRTDDSLEALVHLMNRVAGRRHGVQMQDFRLAFCELTGRDEGLKLEDWMRWWNDGGKRFHVPAKPPVLPKELDQRWRRYWGLGESPRRGRERERRGEGEGGGR